jgi:hypothetical protein
MTDRREDLFRPYADQWRRQRTLLGIGLTATILLWIGFAALAFAARAQPAASLGRFVWLGFVALAPIAGMIGVLAFMSWVQGNQVYHISADSLRLERALRHPLTLRWSKIEEIAVCRMGDVSMVRVGGTTEAGRVRVVLPLKFDGSNAAVVELVSAIYDTSAVGSFDSYATDLVELYRLGIERGASDDSLSSENIRRGYRALACASFKEARKRFANERQATGRSFDEEARLDGLLKRLSGG